MSGDIDRPISEHEAAVVNWLLRYSVPSGRLLHLISSVPRLRVVGRCDCGCASVDFETEGQASGSRPIADAVADMPSGSVGLILWGRDDAITGLEIYELDSANIQTLPAVDQLLPWPTA